MRGRCNRSTTVRLLKTQRGRSQKRARSPAAAFERRGRLDHPWFCRDRLDRDHRGHYLTAIIDAEGDAYVENGLAK